MNRALLIKRIIADIFLLASPLFFHWAFFVVAALLFTGYFKKYYEVVAAALFVDLLYGAGAPMPIFFFSCSFCYTCASIILLLVFAKFKSHVR